MIKSFAESKVSIKAKFLKSKKLYPFFRAIEGSEGTTVKIQGKDQIMIGSNNSGPACFTADLNAIFEHNSNDKASESTSW